MCNVFIISGIQNTGMKYRLKQDEVPTDVPMKYRLIHLQVPTDAARCNALDRVE